ncbi:MAG: nucleoside-diphosphate-sugar epimerase [Acidimicrobiales bacterium]|jgi:nucleoside-diphosphate-sugar epimerase
MARVLVTGAAGCVGRFAAADLVARGHEVHGTSRRPEADNPLIDGVRWHHADLLDPGVASDLIRTVQPEFVLHLAWVNAAEWRSADAALHLRWAEVTLEMARVSAEVGVRRFVGTGTCMEYEWVLDRYDEQAERRPATWYGASKTRTWDLLSGFADEVDLAVAWGRIFFVYGPGEAPTRLVPAAIVSLLNGDRFPSTAGTQLRDYLHAADIGRGFATVVDSDVTGAVNVCAGESVRVVDLLHAVGSATGAAHLLDIGAREMAAEEVDEITGDNSILRSLGWEPIFSVQTGIADTVAWFDANYSAG